MRLFGALNPRNSEPIIAEMKKPSQPALENSTTGRQIIICAIMATTNVDITVFTAVCFFQNTGKLFSPRLIVQSRIASRLRLSETDPTGS
jgi:hypothetical protein